MDRDVQVAKPAPAEVRRVIVVGAGRVGRAIAQVLTRAPGYHVILADIDEAALRLVPPGVETAEVGFSLRSWLDRNLAGATAVICAAPAATAPEIAAIACRVGCAYLDTLEDARTAAQIAEIALGAGTVLVTGCGLAPGLVGALTRLAAAGGDPETALTVRTGVLPCQPQGRLGYADFWGVDGLMSEYTGACLAIRGGQPVRLAPLTEQERCQIEGWDLEAFTTAGTLDRLVSDLAGRIGALTFRTLRTAGHLEYIRFLLDDMNLRQRPYQMKNLLLNALPKGACDRVFIQIERQETPNAAPRIWTWSLAATDVPEGHLAVSMLTAAHVASVLEWICAHPAPEGGVIHADSVPLADLAASRFFPPLPGNVIWQE